MSSPEQRIRDFYGFDFPEDFFRFREFLAELPRGLLENVTDMAPAHPFDVAAGNPAEERPENPGWEDRYYYDLPEFVTLFTGLTDGLHWGYFFDDPERTDPIVASYWHSDTFQHDNAGDDIFGAVRLRIERSEEHFEEMLEGDEADYARKQQGKLETIRRTLGRFWGGDRPQVGAKYESKYGRKSRRKPGAETFSDLGVVVTRWQYRALMSDPFGRQRGSGRVELDREEVECLIGEARDIVKRYPGAALKLGHDLWCWAREYPAVYDLLDSAYEALDRQALRRQLMAAKEYRLWCEGTWK